MKEVTKTRGLNKTLTIIKTKFYNNNIEPTILHTGNGYHIYLPIDAMILESQSIFAEYDQPSRKFIQWSEQYLSNKKADPCHSKGLSFKNCMLRAPGSVNSKNSAQVRIIQKWNGVRPAINWLLREFRRYLIQDKFEDEVKQQRYHNTATLSLDNSSANTIVWIETLLRTAISDYRKNAIRLILAPYLINIKDLSLEKAFEIIRDWLDRCGHNAI